MKKKFSLLIICFALSSSGFAFELGWSGTARVRGGMTLNDGYNDNSSTKSWRSQRVQLLMEGKTEDNIQLQLEVNWGDGDPSDDDNKNVAIDKAYIVAPNFIPSITLSAGFLPLCAHSGVVLDDNFLGYRLEKDLNEKINLAFAMFLIDKGDDTKESANDDSHGFLASISNAEGSLGTDILAQTNCNPLLELEYYDKSSNNLKTFSTADNYQKGTLLWFSPYYIFDGSQVGLEHLFIDINATYLTGSWESSGENKDLSLNAYALSIKPSYNCDEGTSISFDIFYSSGTDSEDAQDGDIAAFRGISPAYSNGLEYFGDGGPTDNSIINLGANNIDGENANNYGALMTALVIEHPLTSKVSSYVALGWAQTSEDAVWIENNTKESSSALGTEIDLGFSYQATQTLALKVTGAFIIPGKATYKDGENDDIMQIGSYLEYAF